jgi:hypothetical protein
MTRCRSSLRRSHALAAGLVIVLLPPTPRLLECHGFVPTVPHNSSPHVRTTTSLNLQPLPQNIQARSSSSSGSCPSTRRSPPKNPTWASLAAAAFLVASLSGAPVWAENELSLKYGGGGIDTTLVDQSCLVQHCSSQATACLKDDPDCRKGLTCTAKCLGDNACITGCMARYGDANLDQLLKCTIEDHDCIKVAILPGGADVYGQEPKSRAPTVQQFNVESLQGSWYKVIGYNPNYDCYACQRNTFSSSSSLADYDEQQSSKSMFSFIGNNNNNINTYTNKKNTLQMDVEFSMPHLLPDGSPLPPMDTARETVLLDNNNNAAPFGTTTTSQSIALNAYHTHETMVFDTPATTSAMPYTLARPSAKKGETAVVSYARTAHSEGEMFGLSK